MYKYIYSLGGYNFLIDSLDEFFSCYAKEYITDNHIDYEIKITENDILDWKKNHPGDLLDKKYQEVLVTQTKVADLLSLHNVFIFHGSSLYLDSKDNGYIFTGPSGVGKSTHVSKLKQYYQDRLSIINDDKPFLKLDSDSYYIYGSPWSGKSHISLNEKSLLKGIFILEQSKTNTIKKLAAKEAIGYLIKQIYIPKGMESSSLGLDFIINLVKKIEVYKLSVNLEDDAIDLARNIMEKDNAH